MASSHHFSSWWKLGCFRFIFTHCMPTCLRKLSQHCMMCFTDDWLLQQGSNHAVVVVLHTGSEPLACSPPGVFSVAVVSSSSCSFQTPSEDIGIMCVRLPGARSFSLYAAERSALGLELHKLPSLGKEPYGKWAVVKTPTMNQLLLDVHIANGAGAVPDMVQQSACF